MGEAKIKVVEDGDTKQLSWSFEGKRITKLRATLQAVGIVLDRPIAEGDEVKVLVTARCERNVIGGGTRLAILKGDEAEIVEG